MYGLIAKITAVAGRREEFIGVLTISADKMPGCVSYIVAKDAMDDNVIWVTEVWDSANSHDASLTLPAVQNAVAQAKSLVAGFEKVAVTAPVADVGSGFASCKF